MIKIYTDGACSGNPGRGGWAAIIINDEKIEKISGSQDDTTNNRMELTAVISALKFVSSNKAINEIVENNISENVIYHEKKYLIKSNFFLLPDEIVFRSFSYLIKKISRKDYPPRGKKMVNLIKQLKNKDHFKATLGGTIIEKIHNSVIVNEEKQKKGKIATS